MRKINKHIVIVRSSVMSLSSLSELSSSAILKLLSRHYRLVEVIEINLATDLSKIISSCPDLVFLGMKFVPQDPELGIDDPDKIWLTDFLDQNKIAYTGSTQFAHELELNKDFAKKRVREMGLNTSDYYVRRRNQENVPIVSLNFPLFIKPTNRGGGQGIGSDSVASNNIELEAKILSLSKHFSSDALVEEYLSGREFSVAILKDHSISGYHTMPLELTAPLDQFGERILSSEVKSSDSESFSGVADLALGVELSELALSVFHALGARDYGRIDIRLDSDGAPHFLEANLLPSLIKNYGNFPKACFLNIGLGYDDMILAITNLGMERSDNVPVIDHDRETKPIIIDRLDLNILIA